MARRGKTDFVDGFATLRAAQRFGVEKKYSGAKPEDESEPTSPKPTTPAKTGGTIGRTVMPTQYQIVCYACGYEFVIRGKAEATQCPKCGARLGLKDETITGAFAEELVTAGKVKLAKSALMNGGTITANDLVIEGIVQSGTLKAFKTIEICAGAILPEELIDARHLKIGAGATVQFSAPKAFGDVEIHGELNATLKASGTVRIGPTGNFLGRLETRHLIVEEGAGLSADVVAMPPTPPPGREATSDAA
jgi:cytoskeletal protein CcmA (bactofilin family)/predicted RNA-binding Zn-ribbon protein involved in translation (DUF1610 family)